MSGCVLVWLIGTSGKLANWRSIIRIAPAVEKPLATSQKYTCMVDVLVTVFTTALHVASMPVCI